jgi:hypothetical protein
MRYFQLLFSLQLIVFYLLSEYKKTSIKEELYITRIQIMWD